MIYPPIDELLKQTKNKYALVVLAAQRAVQLSKGETPTVEPKSNDIIVTALEEILHKKVKFKK